MKVSISTDKTIESKNVAIAKDGYLVPKRGHHGGCVWKFDGQVWYHAYER